MPSLSRSAAGNQALITPAAVFFAYPIALIVATVIFGQMFALPAFAAFAWIVPQTFYNDVIHVFWYPYLMEDFFTGITSAIGRLF